MRGLLAWLKGFFESGAPQSMTRLLALICVVLAAVVIIWHPALWQTVTALIGGGAVALVTRSKDNPKGDE